MTADGSPRASSGCIYSGYGTTNTVISYFFLFLFPVALLLNGVAACVALRLRSTTTFIVYLKNLVAADLLLTLTLPPMATSMLPGASLELQAFACRYSNVIFYCCMYTSIALMGLISQDRFFKIVRPCGLVLGRSPAFGFAACTFVWVAIFGGTAVPTMILTDKDHRGFVNATGDFCMSLKSSAGLSFHSYVVYVMEILFWFVTVITVFCYICISLKVLQSFRNSGSSNSRGKKRTKLRVFLILLVYLLCFVPLHIIRVPFTLYEVFDSHICPQMWLTVAQKLFLWVSSTNACLDPLLYIYLCREFRDKLVEIMKNRGVCVALHPDEGEETSH